MHVLSQVVTLDMGLLVAGTKYRGEFEERLKKLMEEIKQNDDIILVSAIASLAVHQCLLCQCLLLPICQASSASLRLPCLVLVP